MTKETKQSVQRGEGRIYGGADGRRESGREERERTADCRRGLAAAPSSDGDADEPEQIRLQRHSSFVFIPGLCKPPSHHPIRASISPVPPTLSFRSPASWPQRLPLLPPPDGQRTIVAQCRRARSQAVHSIVHHLTTALATSPAYITPSPSALAALLIAHEVIPALLSRESCPPS